MAASRVRGRTLVAAVLLGVLLTGGWLVADWWIVLPVGARATYVGRASCIECHAAEAEEWRGSDHDLAMDVASPQTVLGDFHDATLEHFGVVSRMYREGDKFMVRTEGPDGQLHDYPIKYTFGVRPLQQYLVEMDRPRDLPANEEGRLQVLRISWDTENRRWFYLSPPDVSTRLAPDDPLHWTGSAQNWNHMCASCHSTDVRKNFDVAARQYHTTFAEIDVSCEACHGPASLHVRLARAWSPFWDRRRGYALKQLKASSSHVEIETCAPCHSRRSTIDEGGIEAGESYWDHYENELLRPETYYCDGQVRDEVYEFGSYTQSKMYHKGIRCTDCHNPHSTKLKHDGNFLCTSCHQHPGSKYDTPAHHHHPRGSRGALCVECHMPASPFMEIDWRRDHSLRVPRPDLSVKWQTPNACTGCHIKDNPLSAEALGGLEHYPDWLAAARAGAEPVSQELLRLDTWASNWCDQWYGPPKFDHFADVMGAAWSGEPSAAERLAELASSRNAPAIVRASALWELASQQLERAQSVAIASLDDEHPQIRAVAIRSLAHLGEDDRLRLIAPHLTDRVRLVRTEAAEALSGVTANALPVDRLRALAAATEELQTSLAIHADQAGSHLMRGVLAERQRQPQVALQAYRTAIHVQPQVAGPRSQLALLLEQLGDSNGAAQLRAEELSLLERDAKLAPDLAVVQHRYGMMLYLQGQPKAALAALDRARQLEPNNVEIVLGWTLLNERLENWPAAHKGIEALRRLRPNDASFQNLENRLGTRSHDAPPREQRSRSGQ